MTRDAFSLWNNCSSDNSDLKKLQFYFGTWAPTVSLAALLACCLQQQFASSKPAMLTDSMQSCQFYASHTSSWAKQQGFFKKNPTRINTATIHTTSLVPLVPTRLLTAPSCSAHGKLSFTKNLQLRQGKLLHFPSSQAQPAPRQASKPSSIIFQHMMGLAGINKPKLKMKSITFLKKGYLECQTTVSGNLYKMLKLFHLYLFHLAAFNTIYKLLSESVLTRSVQKVSQEPPSKCSDSRHTGVL